MNSWDKRYSDRVQLLVDIDLTWLPVQDFEADVAGISAALEQLAETFRARPLQLQVQTSGGSNTGGITRLICSRGRARGIVKHVT
ncbi:MAG: hypothetical protein P8Y45_24135 [Exilibacterium sp.]